MSEIATAPMVLRAQFEDQTRGEEFVRSSHDLSVMMKGARYAHTHESTIQIASAALFNVAMVAGGWVVGGGGVAPLYPRGSSSPIARSRTLGEEFCDLMPVQLRISNASPVKTREEIMPMMPTPANQNAAAPKVKYTSIGAQGATPVTRRHQLIYTLLLSFQSLLLVAILKHVVPHHHIHPLIQGILRLHRTIFYIMGNYATLASQFTSYRYLCISPRLQQSYAKENVYLMAGLLRAIVDVTNIVKTVYNLHKNYTRSVRNENRRWMQRGASGGGGASSSRTAVASNEDDDEVDETVGQCMLCLETRKVPTAAVCGHIFCWGCIRDWLHSEPFCPLCRHECKHAELVPLVGYCCSPTTTS